MSDFVYTEKDEKKLHKLFHKENIRHVHLKDGRIRYIVRGLSKLIYTKK